MRFHASEADVVTAKGRAREKIELVGVIFYDKIGREFNDKIKVVDRYNSTEAQANSDHLALAKEDVFSNGIHRYYVKRCTAGALTGNFYNPYNPMAREGELEFFDKASGKRYYEYKEVSQELFSDYVKFLKSGNVAHLRQVERNFITQ